MSLGRIDKPVYVGFIRKCFEESGRPVPELAVLEYAYDLFEGHTYYVHQTMHNVFAYYDSNDAITVSLINDVVGGIIQDKEHSFLTQLSYTQKETLIAIAKDVEATEVASAAVSLRNTYPVCMCQSSTQAIRSLTHMMSGMTGHIRTMSSPMNPLMESG